MKEIKIKIESCHDCPNYQYDGVNGYCEILGKQTYLSGKILKDCPLGELEPEYTLSQIKQKLSGKFDVVTVDRIIKVLGE